MSLLHSFYCWGLVGVIILSTLFMLVFGRENWRWMCMMWAIVPFVNAIAFTRVPIAPLTEEGKGMTARQLFVDPMFWVFMLLMVAAGASETGLHQWASAFAERGLQVSKSVGDLLGPCMFAVCMGIVRVFYAKKAKRYSCTASSSPAVFWASSPI